MANKRASSAPNPLRAAHDSRKRSKASELWFRKCNHGEALFRAYLAAQSVVPAAEAAAFWAALRRPLPITWWVHPRAPAEFARRLRASAHAAPAPWAAGAGVWQASLERRALGAGGEAAALGALLAEGVAAGALSRQEAVSMLPVLALRVAPGSRCLDVCASPGSKTQQLLAAVAGGASEARRVGMVVANDAHPQRVAALLDALGRHGRSASELARLVVTCHRGEALPAPARPFGKRRGGGAGFDRVLCDVPCSGDGTIRKDASVLPRWTPGVGNALHATQLAIAWRGLELLRVGGLLCYSTCSLNPIEDEAVVAALLGRAAGAVELEAWPADVLPALRRRAGLRSWRVADHADADDDDGDEEVALRWHASFDAARAAGVAHAVPTMWPPDAADAARLRLERCSRLLPHDQDTGGFFVALLRKRAPLGGGGGGGGEAAADGELPPQLLQPLPPAEAEALAGRAGLRRGAARRRLLRPEGARGDRAVRVAPPGFAAFAPGALRVVSAGVPLV